MKPFTFRLESILRFRKYLETKAQGGLARARVELQRKATRVENMNLKRKNFEARCAERVTKGIDVPVYRMDCAFSEKLKDDLVEALLHLKESEEEVQTMKEALKEASVKKKSLSSLKDHGWEEYRQALEKEEQKALDERVIIRRRQDV